VSKLPNYEMPDTALTAISEALETDPDEIRLELH
jgi:hypothetical protein